MKPPQLPPSAIRSVTLDLDGTLLDTVPDLCAAANGMLRELGLPQRPENEIRDFVGRGIDNLVLRCLSRDQAPTLEAHERALAVFRRHYAATNGKAAQPFPGVVDGLEHFRKMGLKMAVITNKAAAFTGPLLVATGLNQYLEFAVSGDTLAEKKPHPLPLLHACERLGTLPGNNLHIGDSKHDAEAARAAGCPVFCVPYGYNEGCDVRELDCDAIVASIEAAAILIDA
ncbi:MAG TPA: phosphoglycolate phosphatase [Rhodocyclaceae bacterium]|nr:phosphoglycolate phosphatase [Rhodocyclaceae bacterium]